MLNKIDSGGSMSESTLVTVLADESSITSSSSVHINNNNNKTVRWQPDPKHPDKVLRIRHRYRRPKNPYDLYVNSEEQYQNCLETRGHAKKLRRQLLAEGKKGRGWMAFLSFSEEEASVERLLPLQYALGEQVRGLEKEIISEFKQQSSQHRKRHAQTILLSQALDDVDDDNDAQQRLMSDLSRKSSAKSNSLARLLALVDEHYVQELLKAEPIVLPIIMIAPANEPSTAAENNNKSSNSNDSPEHNHPQESGGERRRKPPRATRSFGPFKQRKERTLPRATRSFSKAVRRIGNNFRRHPDSSSSDIRAPPPHHPPAMPLVPV